MRYAMESGQLARLVRLGSTASQYRKFVDPNDKEINLHLSRRGVPITVGGPGTMLIRSGPTCDTVTRRHHKFIITA